MALEETPPVGDSGNPVTNGPTKLTPVWERAWTTDEMRKHCDRWSLAGDSALLHFLQEFSHKVISKTHEIEQLVNSLDQETKVTNSKVSNTINDFHMLSSTQFVESRVYDEEVQDEAVNSKKTEQKSKEQREAEIVSKISQALELGLSVMDQAFERVEIQQDSDSEDDSVLQSEIILEPRDPYIHRPIPFLIGSENFHRDDYVGLQDVLSEEEKLERETDSDVSSRSESEDEVVPEIHETKERRPTKIRKDSENNSDASDLFPEDRHEYHSRSNSTSSMSEFGKNESFNNDENTTDATDGASPKLLAEELDARLKQHMNKNTKKKDSRRGNESSVRSRSSSKMKEEKVDVKKALSEEDLFSPPPIEEEDDDLFGRKGGLFSGDGKLFDDEKKEAGLFDSVNEKPPKDDANEKGDLISPSTRGRTRSGRKIPAGGISVLGDNNDLFNAKLTPKKTSEKPKKVAPEEIKQADNVESNKSSNKSTPLLKSKGLFDDSDEEDLFSSARKSTVSSVKSSTEAANKKKNTLFASDEEDGLFDKVDKKPAGPTNKKKPVGGVSVFGLLAGEVNAKIKARRPSSDSDSEEHSENLSRTESRASSSSKSSLPTTKVKTDIRESRSNSLSSNSLFLDDADTDDIFSSTKKTSKQEIKALEKDALYDDDSEDLFTTSKSNKKELKNKQSLFDSVEEDDIFNAILKPNVKKSSGSISLYPNEDLPDTKISSESKPLEVKQEEPPQPVPAPKILSLFDEDDGDDLFSSFKKPKEHSMVDEVDGSVMESVTKTKPVVQEEKPIKKNLFDEDEILFGGPTNESPEVDLFMSKKEQHSTAQETHKEPKPVEEIPPAVLSGRKPVGGVALFGGVDLFGRQANSKLVENSKPMPIENSVQEMIQKDNIEEEVITSEIKMTRRAPKLNDTREMSLSFDDPVDTSNTLSSACKDRIRIQGRRRPPSRKNKSSSAKNSATENLKSSLPNGPSANDSPNSASAESKEAPDDFLANKDAVDITSPSTEEEDLFSFNDPLKMHGESNLFSFHDTKTPSSRNKDRDSKTRTDNIFSLPTPKRDSISKEEDDLFSGASSTEKKSVACSITAEENDDDIFASFEGKTDTITQAYNKEIIYTRDDLETPKKETKKSVDFFNDDVDDIFTSLPSKSSGFIKKPSNAVPSLFGDGDDDDIFATKPKVQPVVKRKETSRKVHVLKQTNSVDVFEDPLLSLQKESRD